uniref:DNA polymerase n=1 Tax=Amphimedon queenslandica TaxID=400682 RepID=A0A1X7U2J4_AMPQE
MRGSHLGINLIGQISRVPTATTPERGGSDKSGGSPSKKGAAWFEERHNSDIHVVGRVLLNVWRTMKQELSLTSYSFESVTYHTLYQRLPKFSYQTLTEWYDYRNRLYRSRVVDYYMTHCYGNCLLLEKFNLIGRTSELARLYGIEFHNVLARGSQYRVESMMLRLAKQYNYIAASPSIQQRARMAAPECLPLIMEPESKLYTDPVLVLDFQSLYPSMVIAHNYCYSTCLGRVKHLTTNNDGYKFGTCSLSIPDDILLQLQDSVTISPNGVVFVKSDVRRGVMPQMLEEILNTRIMIKQSMKLYKDNKVLQRILDARQLGLKLIANVTYGYTAANYSGRMPCVEIADSIVRKGRETLERAIQLVESTPKWQAKVIYGDTDSMFVLLKGVSKAESFRIGREISKAVTADNPKPVKLKFKKVYSSCILQTKKRYAGFMYETLDQSEPVFEAKGIETVRRDNCPAVSKILEKSLKLLFSTKDVSLVKSYVQSQCTKILNGRVPTSDFVFAKEQKTLLDRQAEPLVGERVPYVIVYGPPGLPLIQLVRSLEDFTTASSSLRLNSNYYITKQILPALSRSFSLLGVDVFQWYHYLPRSQMLPSVVGGAKKGTISQYFASAHCVICGTITSETPPICPECSKNPQNVAVSLSSLGSKTENNFFELCKICQHCCGSIKSGHYLECVSLDCPVFYSRLTSIKRLDGSAVGSQKILAEFLNKQSSTRDV